MRYHFTPISWLSSKSFQITNDAEDVDKREPLYAIVGNINWYNHYGKWYEGSSKTKNITIIWSRNPLLGCIYQKTKTLNQNYICIQCSQTHTQYSRHGSNPSVINKQMDEKDAISSVQSLSCVWLFATPWIAGRQASLSITKRNEAMIHAINGWILRAP